MKTTIKTYVVNLPQSVQRKAYMEHLLAPYSFLNIQFFNAVYGKSLSEEEINKLFDKKLAYNRYGRTLNPGEIGCSLSHFCIYRKLIESQDNYCLILEDDITILKDISIIPDLTAVLETPDPTVLFLSGDYWWIRKKNVNGNLEVADVYDAVGTYAYLINKPAAKLILSKNQRCANAADNWALFRQQGVKLKAAYPYLIDANIEDFESEVKQYHFGHLRENMPLGIKINSYWVAGIKKILVKAGHFVSKIRVPRCQQSQS